MVEAEMAPTNFETTLKLTEKLVKFIINSILKKQIEELKFLEKYSGKETVSKLKEVIKKDFIQLEYTRAINILKESKEKFIFSNIK